MRNIKPPSEKRNLRLNPTDYIGRKGGIARAKKMTPERRREIALAAAAKRWEGHIKKVKK